MRLRSFANSSLASSDEMNQAFETVFATTHPRIVMFNPVSYLVLLAKGAVIGVANIIPGVSGGTMAVVLGIYDRLIEAIGGVLTDRTKRIAHILFLALIAVGAVIGLKLLAPVITYALEHQLEFTMLFFMGLITGSLPAVIRLSSVKSVSLTDMLALALGVVLVLALGASPASREGMQVTLGSVGWVSLLLSGMLAGGAMIVPGVSGSLVLVLLGTYGVILRAVDKLDFAVLAMVAIGCGLGILVFSILIRWLLHRFANATHCFIFGLVGASVVILFKGFPPMDLAWIWGGICFITGAGIAHASGMVSKPKAL